MSAVAYLNGEFVPRDEAKVSIYDGGFLHGAGLFETMRAETGRVFRQDSHLARLMRSAETLGIPIQREQLPSAEDFDTLLARNELQRARVRLTVTSGSVLTADVDELRPTVCATASEQIGYPDDLYRSGVAVLISPCRQSSTDPLVGHKTTNYLSRLMTLRTAQAQRCAEAIWFTPQNLLAEGSISNVFVVKDGTVCTPPLETPVLPGIARAVVLELCRAASIPTEEKPIDINELLDADEAFLTNVAMQVMPVCRVERKDIGDAKPGPVAKRLLESFRTLVTKECKGDG